MRLFFVTSVCFFLFKGAIAQFNPASLRGEWIVSASNNSDENQASCCNGEEHFVFCDNGDFHDLAVFDDNHVGVQLFQYGKWQMEGMQLMLTNCAYSDKYERKDERKSTSRKYTISMKDSVSIYLLPDGKSSEPGFLLVKSNKPLWITDREMKSINYFFGNNAIDTMRHEQTSIIYSDSTISSAADGYYIRKYDALWSSAYQLPASIYQCKPNLVVFQSYKDSIKPFSQDKQQIVYTEDVIMTYEFAGKDAKKRALRFYSLIVDDLKKDGLKEFTSGFKDGNVEDKDSTGKVLAKGKFKFTKFFDVYDEITESPFIEFDPGLTFLPGGYIVSFHWQNLLRTEMIEEK